MMKIIGSNDDSCSLVQSLFPGFDPALWIGTTFACFHWLGRLPVFSRITGKSQLKSWVQNLCPEYDLVL
jgi:hypothetical protein